MKLFQSNVVFDLILLNENTQNTLIQKIPSCGNMNRICLDNLFEIMNIFKILRCSYVSEPSKDVMIVSSAGEIVPQWLLWYFLLS